MNTHTLKIEQRDPADLRGHFHPSLKLIPELDEKSPEFIAIAAGVGRLTLTEPLKVDSEGRILDDHSRILLRCALRWQFKSVPVIVLPDANVPLLIISGFAHRRHLSKSAIAYLAVPLLDEAFNIARAKMLKKIGDSGVHSVDSLPKTVEELAEELGVGRSMLFLAREIHEIFRDKKSYSWNVEGGAKDGSTVECTVKQWYEPKLLQAFVGGEHEVNRPVGLGGIKAGYEQKKANPDKFSPKSANQLELALGGINTMTSRLLKLPLESMKKSIRDFFASEDAEDFTDEEIAKLEEMGETIKTQAKQLRKKATA